MTGLLGLRLHVTVLTVLLPLPAGTEPGAHCALHSLMGTSKPDGGVLNNHIEGWPCAGCTCAWDSGRCPLLKGMGA